MCRGPASEQPSINLEFLFLNFDWNVSSLLSSPCPVPTISLGSDFCRIKLSDGIPRRGKVSVMNDLIFSIKRTNFIIYIKLINWYVQVLPVQLSPAQMSHSLGPVAVTWVFPIFWLFEHLNRGPLGLTLSHLIASSVWTHWTIGHWTRRGWKSLIGGQSWAEELQHSVWITSGASTVSEAGRRDRNEGSRHRNRYISNVYFKYLCKVDILLLHTLYTYLGAF